MDNQTSTLILDAPPEALAQLDAQLSAAEAELNAEPAADRTNASAPRPGADAGKKVDQPSAGDKTAATKPKIQAPEPPKPAADAKTQVEPKTEVAKPAPEKAQSNFAKEQARRDNSWKALNAEKEALAKDRADWQREKLAAEAATPQVSAEACERAALAYEEKGQFEMAELARAEALKLKTNPPATSAKHFESVQQKSWAAVKQKFPAVMTKGTPENAIALEILAKHPELFDRIPNAPEAIAIMAQHRIESAGELTTLKTVRVPELESEVAKLKSRIQELEEATSPGSGGGDTTLNAAKSFGEMSLQEQENQLRNEVRGMR